MFTLTHTDGAARRGVLQTPHGEIETPVFMPVGTQGVVKALTSRHLEEIGASIILGNTYHLMLRPGDALIARRGGLHKFSSWNGPILTDSGGFQVFSLADRRKIDENGVEFRSHLDGSKHRLTAESAVDIQLNLGSDIAMVLDECPALPSTPEIIQKSLQMSARWARRCREHFLQRQINRPDPVFPDRPGPAGRKQMQFGIVQGGTFRDLRAESAELTVSIGFEGYALGGLSVGEPNEVMYRVVEETAPLLPAGQPRYLMGVGTPIDIVENVARGIDMFDCVMPSRNARHGKLFTSEGPVNIKNAEHAEDDGPVDPNCACYTCKHFSRAYLRHLFVAEEMTAATLNTLHNLSFYLDTMRRIREAISFGRFEDFRQKFHQTFTRRALIS